MRKMIILCAAALLVSSFVSAKEFAIIKDSIFGSQKIELYPTLKEALDNYIGEGKIYEITLKPIPVKRTESKKKVEISEFRWTVEEKPDKSEKTDKAEKSNPPKN